MLFSLSFVLCCRKYRTKNNYVRQAPPWDSNILKMVSRAMNSDLRILCLHGKYQNKTTFAKRMRHITQQLEGVAKFLFVDGPVKTRPKILRRRQKHEEDEHDFRSWWTQSSQPDIIESMEQYLKPQDGTPIDGILGFSQGAALGAILCTNAVRCYVAL